VQGTGTHEIDQLGGLLNGCVDGGDFSHWRGRDFGFAAAERFVSEFLIFLGAFKGGISTGGGVAVPLLALIIALALIGGLAVGLFYQGVRIVSWANRAANTSLARARRIGPCGCPCWCWRRVR